MEAPLTDFIKNHHTVFVGDQVLLVSPYNHELYINFNSMCQNIDTKVERWKRSKDARALITSLDSKARPLHSFYSSKNFGTL